jgi:hypothetical protein
VLGGPWHEDLALLIVLVDHPGIGARELRGPGGLPWGYGPFTEKVTAPSVRCPSADKTFHLAW